MVDLMTEWVVDTGATRHFCANKDLISDFVPSSGGEQVYMGNSSVSEVVGKGKILLKLNSSKKLTLINVLFVPSLRRI